MMIDTKDDHHAHFESAHVEAMKAVVTYVLDLHCVYLYANFMVCAQESSLSFLPSYFTNNC